MAKIRMKRVSISFVLLLFMLTTSMAGNVFGDQERSVKRNTGKGESRIALVIGNGAYKEGILKNPVNDAADMAATLKDSGFYVSVLENGNQRQMEDAIRSFGDRLRDQGGVGLFYYAGHGIQYQGSNYLIPVGARISSESDVKYEAVDAGRVLGKMEDAGNGLNIVILDACRNNPFARSFRSAEQGLARMDAPTGSIIAYATSPGSVAADGTGRNGLYTGFLLKYLQQPGLTIEQMFKKVRQAVLRQTGSKQTPWESSSLTGNFYFTKGEGSTPAPVAQSTNADAVLWKVVTDGNTISDYEFFLEKYPESNYAAVAQLKIRQLKRDGSTGADASIGNQSSSQSPLQSYTDSVTGMEFVYVPKGCFQIGSPSGEDGRDEDEGPVHEVCIDGFYLGKYEVTNAEYRKFKSSHNSKDYKGKSLNGDSQPAVYVSWDDAREYARWLTGKTGKNFRLPTEAEWEYGARGGTSTSRFWGDSPNSACKYSNVADKTAKRNWSDWTVHYCDDGYAVAAPVGSFNANDFGLYDMLGNVWEWCNDWYGENYYGTSPRDNPVGPSSGKNRVFRGGGWFNGPRGVRSAIRIRNSPDYRYFNLGFRLVLQADSIR